MLQAIETKYKGYNFRSRLEARWAVFFDALNVRWEYEKEGFNLAGDYYLPDFFLRDLDCFFEVKGVRPDDTMKQLKLAELGGKNVFMAIGGIPLIEYIDWWSSDPGDTKGSYGAIKFSNDFDIEIFTGGRGDWGNHRCFVQCNICGKIEIEYWKIAQRFCNDCDGMCWIDTATLKNAYELARSARF